MSDKDSKDHNEGFAFCLGFMVALLLMLLLAISFVLGYNNAATAIADAHQVDAARTIAALERIAEARQ